MEFRGLEMKDKGIYFVNLCEGGCAVYQFKDCLDYERPTQYYYRLFLKAWRHNEALSFRKNSTITMKNDEILEIREANENEVAMLGGYVRRTGGAL